MATCELYRLGFTPRIIDKKDGPSPLSRAVDINARSFRLEAIKLNALDLSVINLYKRAHTLFTSKEKRAR